MGLGRGGYSKIPDGSGQKGGTEGCLMLDGLQGGTEAAGKGRGLDGCRELLLDGPQRGRSTTQDPDYRGGKKMPNRVVPAV